MVDFKGPTTSQYYSQKPDTLLTPKVMAVLINTAIGPAQLPSPS